MEEGAWEGEREGGREEEVCTYQVSVLVFVVFVVVWSVGCGVYLPDF